MKEYCVYWFENGEPRHEVFSCLDGAEMFSCMIRGQDGVEHVEIPGNMPRRFLLNI